MSLVQAPSTTVLPAQITQPEHPEISIVIPCLNEARTLESVIRKANRAIARHCLRAEIIVADNGSQDGSQDIAKALGARVVHASIGGYGAALQEGFNQALGKYVIMGDGDDSYDFSEIFPFVEALREGYDLVMGCRLPRGGGSIQPGAMPWLHRWLGNPTLSAIGRLFFASRVTDFHCGLRGLSRDFYHTLDVQSTGMEFASEMIIKATLLQARIAELPITLYKDGRNRPPHLRTWRDGWRHLRFMLLYSPRWLFLLPGVFLFALGFLGTLVLTLEPIQLSSVTLGSNSLLLASMTTLIGFNLVTFSIFCKSFSISTHLLPSDPFSERFWKRFSLELGLGFGGIICLLGLSLIGFQAMEWVQSDFGPLSYPDSQRLVIPGTTLCVLGVEIIFSSFVLSLLSLITKQKKKDRSSVYQ